MSVSAGFLWRFLEDVWDLLPTEDRKLFETFWSAQVQIASNLEQKVMEAGLSTEIAKVPVFLSERWNRLVMDDETCDLFPQTDELTLVLLAAVSVSRETAFFDTLQLTSSSGQIFHEETLRFFDTAARSLRYGDIIPGTVAVVLGGQQFTLNRDYAINLATGVIQALDDGRIPTDETVTVRYQHRYYTRDLDYELDEVAGTVARIAGTTIADGATVRAMYTYNGTATLPMTGSSGEVEDSTLTDVNADFSAVKAGRTLVITGGPNAGTYTINAVVSPIALTVAEVFPSTQAGDVPYTINAFPHGLKVDKAIVSIPNLRDLVDDPTQVLIEGVDYVVQGGLLASRVAFRVSSLGPEADRRRQMWAEVTQVNRETPYRNFGVLIDFFRENSEEYKLALQGLWYTFWTGSTPGNLQRGMHILLGLPFAKRAGTVTRLDTTLGEVDVTDPRGQVITYLIPTGLAPVVARGDAVARFDSLTTGVSIIDRNNEPGFVANRLGRAGINRFLTSDASRGPGDTDETKALRLLEHHLFLPQILVEAVTRRVNVTELVTFLDNMKPQWTEYVFSFQSEETETLTVTEDDVDLDVAIDLSTLVANNEFNSTFSFDHFYRFVHTGGIDGSGSQATGNFFDNMANFVTLGVDAGDTIWIPSGPFYGYRAVLARFSSTLLAIDIPDADLQTVLNLTYAVLTEEQSRLNHDAVCLRNEHIARTGFSYSAPGGGFNTKTDADLSWLSNTEVTALLLIDITNGGAEVQEITAADVTTGDLTVAAAPAIAFQGHKLASAALVRVDNTGPTVTDAVEI